MEIEYIFRDQLIYIMVLTFLYAWRMLIMLNRERECKTFLSMRKDIEKDLELKKAENPEEYAKLYDVLKKVFECHDVADEELDDIVFETGYPVDHIVKATKWLFIEQDIRYWNYSGRGMTWGLVPEK
jgi:hypothetical protein